MWQSLQMVLICGEGDTPTQPYPDAAGEQLVIVSDDAEDGVGGTGIQEVKVHYLAQMEHQGRLR